MSQYFGKYRGKVENNIDPEMRGRIQVSVPAVLGDGNLSWAMPCAAYAGPGVGLFAVPPNDASVWVEFEEGRADSPIWSGCFWEMGEAPADPAVPFVKVFKTDSLKLELNDTPGAGGFTLEVSPPAATTPLKIVCDASGIELSNSSAKVKLTPASVSINDGALEVV